LLRYIAGEMGTDSKLPISVVPHRPQGAIRLNKHGVGAAGGSRSDIADNQQRRVLLKRSATDSQLSPSIPPHSPQTAVVLEKKTIPAPREDLAYACGNLHRGLPVRIRTIPQLAIIIKPHPPERAVAFYI